VTADLVISDTLKLLKTITNHDSLFTLMSKLSLIKDLSYMSKVSENRIMNTLTEFTHPGGPYFPTRTVRQLSNKVMTALFPSRPAKRARKLVHSFFRLLHPYYWAESVSYHTFMYIKSGFTYVKSSVTKCLRRYAGKLFEDN